MATIRCTCKSAFQDSLYGKGNRAFTVNKKGEQLCTVCHPGTLTTKMHNISKNWMPIYSFPPKSKGPIYS